MGLGRRRRAVAAAAISCMLLIQGCGNDFQNGAQTLSCDAMAAPVFLASKHDDDDGDGNFDDEDYPAIDDEDDDIADHAWTRDRFGLYHLFFQNEGHGSGNEIEHYTSPDLQRLDYVGQALKRNPSGWDSEALWSPSIIQVGRTYFMFYTGTSGRGADTKQRLGLAISEDLVTWTRYPVNHCPGSSGDGCIYQCDEPWTTWGGEEGSYNQQCRDPFVIRDEVQQRWVLFATARSQDESGVVTVAYSEDLVRWTGAGFIEATGLLLGGVGGQPTGGQAENPTVTEHAGVYTMLFCDWQDPEDPAGSPNPRTIVQYVTSSTLTADTLGSRHWVYRGYIPDPGVNAIEVQVIQGSTWVMTQSISNENSGDYPLHRRHLRLKCIDWGEGFTFGTSNLALRTDSPGSGSTPLTVDFHGDAR